MNISPWTNFITYSSHEHMPITLIKDRSSILKQFYPQSFLPNTLSPCPNNSQASLHYNKKWQSITYESKIFRGFLNYLGC